jgi:biopolymer transport protein ExbD
MPIPLAGRIGIYLTVLGLALTLLLAHFWGLDILFPGVALLAEFLLVVGVFLLFRTAFAQLDEKKDWATKALRLTDTGPQPRTLHFPETSLSADREIAWANAGRQGKPFRRQFGGLRSFKTRFSSLPSFGLFCSLTLVFGVFFIGLILTLQFAPSRGIRVHLARSAPRLLFVEPLIVRMNSVGPGLPPKLYLNSQSVLWEMLVSSLQESLKLRPDWVVYVEADPEVDWQHIADVIDAGRNIHARVVLLTIPSGHER